MTDFSITITPRSYETDALGHINNVSITAWFEVLRVALVEAIGAGVPMARNWVLASITLDYLQETFYGSDVTLTATGLEVGNSSLTIHCEMVQDGRLTVRGRGVLVCMDRETGRSRRIPDEVRAAVEAL